MGGRDHPEGAGRYPSYYVAGVRATWFVAVLHLGRPKKIDSWRTAPQETPQFSSRSVRETVLLPVEALPGGVEAVDDPVELGPAVGVGRPELLDRVELGDPGQTVLGGLGHLHLTRQEAPVAVARVDPESFRRLLGEEPRLLVRGHAAEKEARGEADRARAGREEMRQLTEAAEVAGPPFAREQLS